MGLAVAILGAAPTSALANPSAGDGLAHIDSTRDSSAVHHGLYEGSGPPGGMAADTSARTPLVLVAPGHYRLGPLEIDSAARTIIAPGAVNMTSGDIEVFAASKWGKLHESVLRIDADPVLVQVALLLIGGDTTGQARPVDLDTVAGPTDLAHRERMPVRAHAGNVAIRVGWTDSLGKHHDVRAESLLVVHGRAVCEPVDWRFVGGRLTPRGFSAEWSGTIAAVYSDPGAILSLAHPLAASDDVWTVNGYAWAGERFPPPPWPDINGTHHQSGPPGSGASGGNGSGLPGPHHGLPTRGQPVQITFVVK